MLDRRVLVDRRAVIMPVVAERRSEPNRRSDVERRMTLDRRSGIERRARWRAARIHLTG